MGEISAIGTTAPRATAAVAIAPTAPAPARCARNHAGGGEPRRSREPGEGAPPLLHDAAGLLFEQCLLQVARGDADVLPQREQLVLGQPVADVALRRLELGGALDDPLERLAADELRGHRYAWTLLFSGAAGRVSREVRSGSAGV